MPGGVCVLDGATSARLAQLPVSSMWAPGLCAVQIAALRPSQIMWTSLRHSQLAAHVCQTGMTAPRKVSACVRLR